MAQNNKETSPKGGKSSERFAAMVETMRRDGSLAREGVRIEVAEIIFLWMRQAGIDKRGLARKLKRQGAYVTTLLDGTAIYTLDELVAVARALNSTLIIGFESATGGARILTPAK